MVCCMCAAECCLVQAVDCNGLCEIGLTESDCWPLTTIPSVNLDFTCESRLHDLHIDSFEQSYTTGQHSQPSISIYRKSCVRDSVPSWQLLRSHMDSGSPQELARLDVVSAINAIVYSSLCTESTDCLQSRGSFERWMPSSFMWCFA